MKPLEMKIEEVRVELTQNKLTGIWAGSNDTGYIGYEDEDEYAQAVIEGKHQFILIQMKLDN